MKANEIRLNNLFSQKGFPMYVEAIFRDTVYLNFEGNEGDIWKEDAKTLVPIPLTEEILLKAGFKKDVNGILWFQITPDRHFELIHSQGYYYPQLAQSPEVSCEVINVVSLNRIESVHQFQNLFFALTGEEIKIEV